MLWRHEIFLERKNIINKMIGALFACFLMFFKSFIVCSVFWASSVARTFSLFSTGVFNHSGLPSSALKFKLLYNFQVHSLKIDTNTFLFKQIVFTLNFAHCFGYGLCLPNLPL